MQTLSNGTHPHKVELSWDDVASGNLPPHTVDLWRQAVSQAAATMDAPPYNDQKGKLTKAMDLVLEGKVQPHQDGLWTAQGSTKPYEIDGECPCPQGQRAASKWCKHLVAVELWKRANERLHQVNGNGNHKMPKLLADTEKLQAERYQEISDLLNDVEKFHQFPGDCTHH